MKLVDANVLLYSVHENAQHHTSSKAWLDDALSGTETVLIPWVSVLAFLRLSTHPSVFERPLDIGTALTVIDGWYGRPNVLVPEADARHVARMRELLGPTGSGGNLVNDAYLAALALQFNATVVTSDNDFGRFGGVRWEMPPQ
ncbi:hypothetical protein BKD30_14735 [Tersicoccus phoenicis]|uniref:Ribonuclease VapC n=1 Tax=Tersicoccus phoenicis TaxID=554083 RepID=A0A1R1L6F1_9MICC|nr:TA system VapC family ribonuclease toxin [Tersicoccus phoenicis]OMH23110.1 hypothetical protein BKD30_14735 [Tersicoccus phoenicis]